MPVMPGTLAMVSNLGDAGLGERGCVGSTAWHSEQSWRATVNPALAASWACAGAAVISVPTMAIDPIRRAMCVMVVAPMRHSFIACGRHLELGQWFRSCAAIVDQAARDQEAAKACTQERTDRMDKPKSIYSLPDLLV